ncbi:UNKNOWN [Stylonychia lemnae]|uniref:Uncharacterized protein n=1 Tax=Stylonychia lemnae TaxID=5949 RepID=A0A078B5K0_STYLE|nr:UNKNOWN [Stylonychia lemnae]|eukprot:CDW88798.1 UNKNOWN [Stylonychia lemnae]
MVEAMQSQYSELTKEEVESLDMQLKMLAYQTLDLFDEKQRLKGTSKVQAGPSPAPILQSSGHGESTYLGLIMETCVSQYQMDLYGYISNTNYKYIIIKNETKTTQLGQKPNDEHIKNVFIIAC